MSFESLPGGGTMVTGKRDILIARTITLWRGLKLEIAGIRLKRNFSCYAIIKREFGFKGNRDRVLEQMQTLIDNKPLLRTTIELQMEERRQRGRIAND